MKRYPIVTRLAAILSCIAWVVSGLYLIWLGEPTVFQIATHYGFLLWTVAFGFFHATASQVIETEEKKERRG